MDILTYLTPIAAFFGVVLSIISILYTQYQNKRRINANIKLNLSKFRKTKDPRDIYVDLSAFNSGFRSVAIISYEIFVNDKSVDHFDSFFGPNITDTFPLPHVINEGEIAVTRLDSFYLSLLLDIDLKKGFSEKIKLSGYFETAENKIYPTNSIEIHPDMLKTL